MTGDERTRRIVTASAAVIVRDGLRHATTRSIADEAGVPLGLIHYAFADKQSLVAAVYEHWIDGLIAAGIDVVEADAGLARGARTLAEAVFSWAETDLNLAAAQYELLLWANRSAPTLAAAMYQRWADLWGAALRRAAEPGTRAHKVQDALDQLLITVDGVFVRLLATGDVADARRLLDRMLPPAEARRARPSSPVRR